MPQSRTCRIFSAVLANRFLGPMLACALAFPPLARPGGAPAPDTLALPDARSERPLPPPSAIAKAVITPTDVDRQLGNLADMLQRAAGLHVVRTGGMGDYTGVSVWGSSENQVNIYVDGVLQNRANDGSMFLGDWDLSRVERVEVFKGLAPDNLAGSPMGGAINIITRSGGQGAGARGALGAGSFGTLRANGSAEYRKAGWTGRVEAARNQADGDFVYYDDNGTEFKPGRNPNGAERLTEGDLTRKIRRNNAHRFSEIAANAGYTAGAWDLGAQVDATRLHKQIPSPDPNVDSSIKVLAFRDSDRLFARGFGHWTGSRLEGSFDLSGSYQGDAYVDRSGAVGVGNDDDHNTYTELIGTTWARARAAEGLTVAALGSYGISGYVYTNRMLDIEYPRFNRYTGEGKITPVYSRGRHTLEGILAATVTLEEQYGEGVYAFNSTLVPDEDWDSHWSMRLGYQYRIRDGIWLSAQGGSSYRIPTFLERFGDRGTIVASAGLRPEAGATASGGLHAEGKGMGADLQVFATEGRRLISLRQNAQHIMFYGNTGATRVFGIESRLTASPRSWTRTDLDLTLQKAIAVSSGSRLIPYRPLSQMSLRQSFFRGGWTLSATGYYQGLAHPNASNQGSLFDSYSHNTDWQARCDADLSWRIKHLLLAAGLRNIFDQRLFDFFNYPLPGRNFAATMQLEY
jgi:iron complex outermembrane recepter protein